MIDLHTHSNFSDGTLSPKELILRAKGKGIDAIALCDHNTFDGLESFLKEAEKENIEAVAGIEISTEYKDIELHVVGLFVEKHHYKELFEMLEIPKKEKEKSNLDLINKLNALGYDISYQEVKNSTKGNVNRANIAAILLKKGYVSSVKDAFKTLLSPNNLYIPPKRLDVFEVIKKLRSMKIISVLAHPFLNLSYSELEEFLPMAKESGLVAIETEYSKYDEKTAYDAKKLSEKYGLLQSGGSDFHGENKPDIDIGTGKGNLNIPYSFLVKLRQELNKL